jgi:hypothetical protein
VGGHNRALDRPALSIHLLAVVVLAAAASFLPSAFSGHSPVAEAAVPSRLPAAAVASSELGASIGSAVSFSRLLAEGIAKPIAPPVSKRVGTTKAGAPAVRHEVQVKTRTTTAVASKPSGATTQASSEPAGYGCSDALAYLHAHAAPGFSFECPGYAEGHQAMTCVNIAGLCPGAKLIAISTPCAAAYMNEASNSWVLSGKSDAPIDPYGYCHS